MSGKIVSRFSALSRIGTLLLTACAAPSPPPNTPVATTAPATNPMVAGSTRPAAIQSPSTTSLEHDSAADRADPLLAAMTLAEKIGQMTQVEQRSISDPDVKQFFIGSVLSGGSGYPRYNTPRGWVEMVDGFQEYALETRSGIPITYGVDAVHGHNTLKGAVIFPHNVGLGATRDPDLVERVARATAEEMIATGID